MFIHGGWMGGSIRWGLDSISLDIENSKSTLSCLWRDSVGVSFLFKFLEQLIFKNFENLNPDFIIEGLYIAISRLVWSLKSKYEYRFVCEIFLKMKFHPRLLITHAIF